MTNSLGAVVESCQSGFFGTPKFALGIFRLLNHHWSKPMCAEDCGRARGRARGRAIWNIPPGSCTETDANIVVRKLHGSDANEPSVRAQISRKPWQKTRCFTLFHKVLRKSQAVQHCSFECEVADAKEGGICTAAVLCPWLSSLYQW